MKRKIEFGTRAVLLAAALALLGATAMYGSVTHTQAPKASAPHAPGYLGIGFHDISEEQASSLHLKGVHGVEVLMVDHDGPAGKSLRPHDILLSLNGQSVTAEALKRMIHDMGAGVAVTLGIVRGGQPQTVKVQLANQSDVQREAMARMALPPAGVAAPVVVEESVETYTVEPDSNAAPVAAHSQSFLGSMLHMAPFTGLAMEEMEPQLGAFFGAPSGTGLLVQTVMPNSPAAAAGLHAGDVVVRADNVPLHTSSDWMKHLHLSKGLPIALLILRDKHEQTILLTPEFKKHSLLEWPVLF